VGTWDDQVNSSEAFQTIRRTLLEKAAPTPVDQALDLGSGTGFVTLALAPLVKNVLAIDFSKGMLGTLEERAAEYRISNILTQVADLASVDLPHAEFDLIVSNYALHHLKDGDKKYLVRRMSEWLRPGGRVVLSDMMFGLGATRHDRRILLDKVRALAGKGPGGLWRIAKNVVRFGLKRGKDLPATPEFWKTTFIEAGFEEVGYESIVSEAGLIVARLPGRPSESTNPQD